MISTRRIQVILIAVILLATLNVHAQVGQSIQLGQQVQGELNPSQSEVLYQFQVTVPTSAEVLLTFDQRDFNVELTLLDSAMQELDTNAGLNYPRFQGAYLYTTLNRIATYFIRVRAVGLTAPAPYTLSLLRAGGDEPRTSTMIFQSQSGIIGPVGDIDEYVISLRRGATVLIALSTPNDVLDSIMGVVDPLGNFVAINRDFLGTRSVILFTPEQAGNYLIVIGGDLDDSVGPYTLVVTPVAFYDVPFTYDDELILPGDILAYEVQQRADQTYDFTALGVDNLQVSLVLTDETMGIISSSSASDQSPFAFIPGFTPLFDGSLYLFVTANDANQTGFFNVSTEVNPDEADGIHLNVGTPFASEIGPAGDVDEYTFTVQADRSYSIQVTTTWHYLDPEIQVLDAGGNVIFSNDDSADGLFSLLSGIRFPAAGDYRLRVFGSGAQPTQQRLTGVYMIQINEGAGLDRSAPHFYEPAILVTREASGALISIPTTALYDDTYPLSATLTYERTGETLLFQVPREEPVEVHTISQVGEIFFLEASDSADTPNHSLRVVVPPPTGIVPIEGQPVALAVDRNNQLFVVESELGRIVQVDINGATRELTIGLGTAGGSAGPNALAFDSQGELYLSNGLEGTVSRIFSDGVVERVADQLKFPVDIAFGPGDVLYVAQVGSDTIDRIYPDGTREPFVTGIRNPNTMAFSPSGELFVGNSDRGRSAIYRIRSDGTPDVFVAPFAEVLEGMAFDRDGFLYVADGIQGLIYRVDAMGNRIAFARGMAGPVDLAFGYGEQARRLFAINGGIESPDIYAFWLIAIPTGHEGLPLPFGTAVADWKFF